MLNTHTIVVRFDIERYEDTGTGYMTAKAAHKSARDHLDLLIAKQATDTIKDGTVQGSLAAMAGSMDIVSSSIEDNGEECDGDDIGRWTIAFAVIARFTCYAHSRKAAEDSVLADIDDVISDPMDSSVEEWACNLSADIVR